MLLFISFFNIIPHYRHWEELDFILFFIQFFLFFLFPFQLLHCASFVLALLGFIYNSLAEKEIGTGLGKISAGIYESESTVTSDRRRCGLKQKIEIFFVHFFSAINMGLFITRIILELAFIEFRPEEMSTAT